MFKILLVLIIFSFKYNQYLTQVHNDYCLIGAGPAGLQLAYFLHKSNRQYMIFERNDIPGSFFRKFPRKRKLISLNKRHTGELNDEFNLRHDWHSFLALDDQDNFRFTNYSKDNFPNANILVKYMSDFVNKFNLNIKYNTEIKDITCISNNKEDYEYKIKTKKNCNYKLVDQNSNSYSCKVVIVSTGLNYPNIPENLQHIEGYETVSINPDDYEGKSVLILGKGNSAFEVAQTIYGSTNFIHMLSRSRIRNAFSTHYVGDVRALNNDLIDTYQLKSLDGFLDLDLNTVSIDKIKDKYYMRGLDQLNLNDSQIKYDLATSRVGYDKVIRCLGFKFNFDIFNKSMSFSKLNGRIKKYPKIEPDYESSDYHNLYFAGTNTHSLDFRQSSGGFIHGFRYTIRALFKIIENRYDSVKWPSKVYGLENLINFSVRRMNEASGPYQMFGLLVDVYSFDNRKFEYFEEFPLLLLPHFEKVTGKRINSFFLVNYEYGANFSKPGSDVFNLDRATTNPKFAHKSNFLHPVIYYYSKLPEDIESESLKDIKMHILKSSDKKLHIVEDFLTFWNEPRLHQLQYRRFLEMITKKDLKLYTRETCLKYHSFYSYYPINCKKYLN